MAFYVSTNTNTLSVMKNLKNATTSLHSNFKHMATGSRIASASDDAAGLAISERLRSSTRSLAMAHRNVQDGISICNVIDGALGEVNNILVRMRELAVQAGNGTLEDVDKDSINEEYQALEDEANRIAKGTMFNGRYIMGANPGGVSLQIGSDSGDTLSWALSDYRTGVLGIAATDISSTGDPDAALTAIDGAVEIVSTGRAETDARINRLSSVINTLDSSIENFTVAESRIRDVDIAMELALLTKNTVKQQSAISMLAQANINPNAALDLFKTS